MIYVNSVRQLRDAKDLEELYTLWQAAVAQHARTGTMADFELAVEGQYLYRRRKQAADEQAATAAAQAPQTAPSETRDR